MASTDDFFAAIDRADAAAVRRLLQDEPDLALARDEAGVSALLHSLYRADAATIGLLLEAVPDMDVFEAAAFGVVERLGALLEDPDVCSPDGFSLLHLAAFFGHTDVVELLLARGTGLDPRGRGWMTGTPLHSAAGARHPEIVALLLAAGADPNARQSGGWTPLHAAAGNGDLRSVRALLAAGADRDAVNDDGRSVEDLAREGGDPGVLAEIGSPQAET
jgi:ankyrin repeat protein